MKSQAEGQVQAASERHSLLEQQQTDLLVKTHDLDARQVPSIPLGLKYGKERKNKKNEGHRPAKPQSIATFCCVFRRKRLKVCLCGLMSEHRCKNPPRTRNAELGHDRHCCTLDVLLLRKQQRRLRQESWKPSSRSPPKKSRSATRRWRWKHGNENARLSPPGWQSRQLPGRPKSPNAAGRRRCLQRQIG